MAMSVPVDRIAEIPTFPVFASVVMPLDEEREDPKDAASEVDDESSSPENEEPVSIEGVASEGDAVSSIFVPDLDVSPDDWHAISEKANVVTIIIAINLFFICILTSEQSCISSVNTVIT